MGGSASPTLFSKDHKQLDSNVTISYHYCQIQRNYTLLAQCILLLWGLKATTRLYLMQSIINGIL